MASVTSSIILSSILSSIAWLASTSSISDAKQNSPNRKLNVEQWREDVRHFARELEKRHKNLYHATSREQFERAISDLDRAIPSMQDHEIVVRLHQIAASVGDGHTGVHQSQYFRRFPIAVYWFGSELRVVAATSEYKNALGARLLSIGGLGIDAVEKRIRSCFPSAENENEWYVLNTSPAFIVVPEVLHALRIVPDRESAQFTFEDAQGKPLSLVIKAVDVPLVNGAPTLRLLPASAEQPLFRQRPTERFWFTYLPEAQTVYVNFRGYDSLAENARQLFEFVDANPTKRLVVDMRQNGGGDFIVGRRHLIEPVKKRPAINQKGRLFVIIGRRTFSAAMANAIHFRKETNAILVGEPTGERPNSYSENDEMTLPNSRLVVSYSTQYYKFLDEDVPAVLPDKRIDPNWPDFQKGRDPVMEWILALSP